MNIARFTVGQNIAWRGNAANVNSIDVARMVKAWYDDVKNFNKNDVSNYK